MIERHRTDRSCEYNGAASEIFCREARKLFRVERTFGNRHIAGCFDESCKFFIRYICPIHPKAPYFDLMDWLGIFHVIASHPEASAWYPNHAIGSAMRSVRFGRRGEVRLVNQGRCLQGVTRDSGIGLRRLAALWDGILSSVRTILCDSANAKKDQENAAH